MHLRIRFVPAAARAERGIALPLALVGLICVTLMITAALLTSSTEAAISSAHKDAASDLYLAETGVQRYVATQFGQAAPFAFLPQQEASTVTVGTGGNARQVQVRVVELLRMPSPGVPVGPSVYVSVAAAPLDGNGRPRGRTISSLIRLTSTITQMNLQMNAGLTLGGSANVTGNSEVVSKSDMCTTDTRAGDVAITHADGTTVSVAGSATVDGGIEKSSRSGNVFRDYILNGKSLQEYAANADVKFGPLYQRANFDNSIRPNAANTNLLYNWGCPANMGITCPTGSTTNFPMVAIDASTMTGKQVHIKGDYGQGILVVMNGHLRIEGNFVYKGIILVEGILEIKGTAGGTAKIEGTVAAFNEVDGLKSNEISETSGNAVIRFNRCAVAEAQDAYNQKQLNNPRWEVPTQNPTFAWYELVR